MFTEYQTHEMVTATESKLWNAFKFGTTREVDSQERGADDEGFLLAPTDCSKVGTPQGELNRAVGEALIP